jgi:hypothetical protein
MDDLEGDAAAAPRRPFLAYADAVADHDEVRGPAVRRDSADGDIVESTIKADMRALQRRLNAREAESAQVRSDTLQLRNELEAARAEAAALKDATLRKEHPPPTPSPEMPRASGQDHSANDELQRLIKLRRITALPPHRQVQADQPVIGERSPDEAAARKLGAAIAVAAVVLVLALLWPRVSRWSQERGAQVAWQAPAPIRDGQGIVMPPPAARPQFQSAVDRLSRVLVSRPGRAPEELLREVNQRNQASDPTLCAFDWRSEQPALLYAAGHLSLAQTLERCADAVEMLP